MRSMSETKSEKKIKNQESTSDTNLSGSNGDAKVVKNRPNKRDAGSKPCKPHAHDVLFGRGNGVGKHIGNVYFHQLIFPGKKEYRSAVGRGDRRTVAFNIIKQIKKLDPPGRFLIPDTPNQVKWYEVREHRAMMKTSQALREQEKITKDAIIKVNVVDNMICVESFHSLDNAGVPNPIEDNSVQPPSTYKLTAHKGSEVNPRGSKTPTYVGFDDESQQHLPHKEQYINSNAISCLDRETIAIKSTQDDEYPSLSNIFDLADLKHNITKSSMDKETRGSSQEDTNVEHGTATSLDVNSNVNNRLLSTIHNKYPRSTVIPSIEKIKLDMDMAKGSSLLAITPNKTKLMPRSFPNHPSCSRPSNQTDEMRFPFASSNNLAKNALAEASITMLPLLKGAQIAQHSVRNQAFEFNSDKTEGKVRPIATDAFNSNASSRSDASKKELNEATMNILIGAAQNENTAKSLHATSELKDLLAYLKPFEPNMVSQTSTNKVPNSSVHSVNTVPGKSQPKNNSQCYQTTSTDYESNLTATPSPMLEYAPNSFVNMPLFSNQDQDKAQLAAALINILTNAASQNRTVSQSHQLPSDIKNYPMQVLSEKSKIDVQPILADESHTEVVNGKSTSASGSDYYSSPFCPQNQKKALMETRHMSMKQTQIKNTTQRDEPIPEKYTSSLTGSSPTMSAYPTLPAVNNTSFPCQNVSTKIMEISPINNLMQAVQDKNAKQIRQPPLDTTHHTNLDSIKRYRNIRYEAGLSKNVLNDQQNSGKMIASQDLDNDIMNMDLGGEYAGVKVTTRPSTVITYDDELEDKQQQAQSERPSKKLKTENDYKKFIMPLSYIGRSFATYRLNDESPVTNESKAVFEELTKLGDKGDCAVLYLPSVVGSLCQRIIDLEKQLSK